MKISIGTNIKEGPWGGGNLFALNLINYLKKKEHEVINHLLDDDIDLILITEPRRTSESSAFTHLDVIDYLKYVNADALVVHRINECDERKNTNYVNKYLIEANKAADQTIYVSSWLMGLFLDQGNNDKNNKVILEKKKKKVFNDKDFTPWNHKSKLKIVTHHWGANWNKGFEIYSKLDNMLDSGVWKEKIEFTYIGNLPKKFTFKNTRCIKPLSGFELAKEIKKNNLYITGSLNEPSGNHHIEGAQCGLPLLYIDSGGMSEYCKDYGIAFDKDNLETKINEMIMNYDEYVEKLKTYKFDAELMCTEFESLFMKMYNNKNHYLENRFVDMKKNILREKYFKIKRNIKK